ncbi:hypothetical protein GCM10017783_19770 [Deinococcus piscis]|uniref:TfoX N-terminal domain-containing protein n=1 Tax=Deinococcus piscis TaxID=394230 RepID=A0ABQ3K906_9DEIO|nr:MmcQ/YjbR family DNA-binding protein [Deinococcus piscis]GHG07262.1 hypothetical protein GCM10017783_19770 [Deinococcus piscis]
MTDTLLDRIAAPFAADPDVQPGRIFGSACLKVRGKVFLIVHTDDVTFKLSPEAHAQAMGLPGTRQANPSGRRVLREWVTVPGIHAEHFPALAQAAASFVGASKRRA